MGYGARWSPDGEKISFVSSRDGNDKVYVMNADESGQINVTEPTSERPLARLVARAEIVATRPSPPHQLLYGDVARLRECAEM